MSRALVRGLNYSRQPDETRRHRQPRDPARQRQDSRYPQHRLRLTGSDTATPVVRAIGFTSTGRPPDHPTEGGG
jgi:hypothetical protein